MSVHGYALEERAWRDRGSPITHTCLVCGNSWVVADGPTHESPDERGLRSERMITSGKPCECGLAAEKAAEEKAAAEREAKKASSALRETERDRAEAEKLRAEVETGGWRLFSSPSGLVALHPTEGVKRLRETPFGVVPDLFSSCSDTYEWEEGQSVAVWYQTATPSFVLKEGRNRGDLLVDRRGKISVVGRDQAGEFVAGDRVVVVSERDTTPGERRGVIVCHVKLAPPTAWIGRQWESRRMVGWTTTLTSAGGRKKESFDGIPIERLSSWLRPI